VTVTIAARPYALALNPRQVALVIHRREGHRRNLSDLPAAKHRRLALEAAAMLERDGVVAAPVAALA